MLFELCAPFRGINLKSIVFLRLSWLLRGVFACLVLTVVHSQALAESKVNSEGAIKQAVEAHKEAQEENSPPSDYLPPSLEVEQDDELASDLRKEPLTEESEEFAIYVRTVHFEGGSVFKKDDFEKCSASILKKKVSETELIELSDCVTNYYHSHGYNLSRAVIPPQDVANGRLLVRLIEGHVSSVKFKGGNAERFNLFKFAEPLKAAKPLTQEILERTLFLISDLPGVSIEDTSLQEMGEMTGAFELTLQIKTWQVWSGSDYDNRGSDAIGPYQNYQTFAFNSLFGRGESLQFTYSSILDSTDELNFGLISLDLPLNVHGMRLSAFVSGSISQPDDERKLTNTEFKTVNAGVNLNWNLIRKSEKQLWVGAGVWSRFNEKENYFGIYEKDRLYGLNFYVRSNFKDKYKGWNYLYGSLRQGIDIWDASSKGDANLSNYDGDGKFTRFYGSYSRNQVINDNWSLYFTGALQLSSTSLLSSQEFYYGGSRFGRAYESGVINGDAGAAALLELRYSRNVDWGPLNGFQLYGFADIGTIWDRGNDFIDDAVLSSAGFGARLYLDYGIKADLAAAFPIDDDDLSDAKDAEFFFKLSRSYKLSELRFDQPLAMLEDAFQR